MSGKRFIRNITGHIYDIENGVFYAEEYVGKPLEYDDDVVVLLNSLDEENKELARRCAIFEEGIFRDEETITGVLQEIIQNYNDYMLGHKRS